jgi:hypothetical protein
LNCGQTDTPRLQLFAFQSKMPRARYGLWSLQGTVARKLVHWKPTSTNLCQSLWGSKVKWNILTTLTNY